MTPEWRCEQQLIPYGMAIASMEERVARINQGDAPEWVWFLEHPALYTIGTSGNPADILQNPCALPVHKTGRGGQVTYHGPGQRIGYVMLDLKRRKLAPRAFTAKLEQWISGVLLGLGVKTFTDPKRIGVWVRGFPGALDEERKIAAIGVRIRRGISYHGFALNVCPTLQHFHTITPCGLAQFKATSLEELGLTITAQDVDPLFQRTFGEVFEDIR